MNFQVIEALRLACNGFTDPAMERAYIRTPEAERADKLLTEALEAERLAELEELCSDTASERESQGFINGFRMGVRLMLECGGDLSRSPRGSWKPREGAEA